MGIAFLLPVIIFVVHLFLTTNYTIENGRLTIKSGLFINKTIDIYTIKKITETNNLLSAPATSLDRLEIVYGKFDSIIISPKKKHQFIADIEKSIPSVEVKLRKKKETI